MDSSSACEIRDRLAGVTFEARWNILKPTIERLYIDEGHSISEVAEFIKREYSHDGLVNTYKYYINKKWKLKRNIPASKKTAILNHLQTRASIGRQTVVKYKGKTVDQKKLRRHCKSIIRAHASENAVGQILDDALTISPYTIHPSAHQIILGWNLHNGLFQGTEAFRSRPVSPAIQYYSDLSDVEMLSCSDPDDTSMSPNPNSKLALALSQKKALERAHLFIQGRFPDLLKSMNTKEKRVMSSWFSEFWQSAFTKSRGWGLAHENWAPALSWGEVDQQRPFPLQSDNTDVSREQSAESGFFRKTTKAVHPRTCLKPTSLCLWTVHKKFNGPKYSVRAASGLYQQKLRDTLQSNDFRTTQVASLPMALPQVLKAADSSHQGFFAQAFGFAIMGRDEDLVYSMCQELEESGWDITHLFPFHLATSYLDGSRACCNILDILVQFMPDKAWKWKWEFNVNELAIPFWTISW